MEKYYLNREEAILLIIDIQEKLIPAINKSEKIISNNKILVATSKNMGIPVVVTEQYPKGLGKTVEELDKDLEDAVKFSKMVFSSCSSEVLDHLQNSKRKKVIITGAEAHVCVFQTVRDLLKLGYHVFVAEDSVGSRTKENCDNAIALMREMGAVITNTESIVFDLLKEAGTPEFKTLSKLIK